MSNDKTITYEVWSYSKTYGSGPTVEGEYGNEQEARDAAEFYADEQTKVEVVEQALTDPNAYTVIWSSDDD